MDSKELLRRFRAAGWPGPTQVHALLGEAPPLARDDIERLLGVLVSKGLPGDARDKTNSCFVFRTLAERVIDKALFLSYVRALRGADGQILSLLSPLIPRVNSIDGHAELCALLKEPDGTLRRGVAGILKQIGGTTVFQTLGALCGDASFQGRIEAMDVLVSIGRQDIKPDNFFITDQGVLKVMDFGVAKRHSASRGLTRAGMMAGTPQYMAPEQANNFGSVTHLANIYALGCIAYQMFTGVVPFPRSRLNWRRSSSGCWRRNPRRGYKAAASWPRSCRASACAFPEPQTAPRPRVLDASMTPTRLPIVLW